MVEDGRFQCFNIAVMTASSVFVALTKGGFFERG